MYILHIFSYLMNIKGATGPITTVHTFKLHETSDHYVRLQHEFYTKPISINQYGENTDAASPDSGCLFEVHLAVRVFFLSFHDF